MLFHSSLRRELARSFGATLLVLITIVITMLLIRTLGMASRGSVNPQEIVLVLAFTVLSRMPTVLTLALFIAVVSTLSRMYRDSEMVIWFNTGRGLGSFIQPVFRFAWPILAAIVVMVLFVWPWANQQTDTLRARYEGRGEIERVAPGQFQESSDGRRVFFIDKDSASGSEGRNVFVSSIGADGRETITTARSGRIETDQGMQNLVLENGQHLERAAPSAGGAGLRISTFATYALQIGGKPLATDDWGRLTATASWRLLQMGNAPGLAELGWRIGLGLTAVNFVLLGLAVAASNPRAGRGGNLVFMLLAFLVYYNLLNVGQSWTAQGKVGLLPFMMALHGGAFTLSALWLAKRHFNVTLWPWPRSARRLWGSAA